MIGACSHRYFNETLKVLEAALPKEKVTLVVDLTLTSITVSQKRGARNWSCVYIDYEGQSRPGKYSVGGLQCVV